MSSCSATAIASKVFLVVACSAGAGGIRGPTVVFTKVNTKIKAGRRRRRVAGCGTALVHGGGCPGTCTRGTGSTIAWKVPVNLLRLIMALLILVHLKITENMVLVESSGATSSGSIIVAAWASGTRGGASVAMKVVIRTISLTVKVTSYVLMEEATRASGVEGNGAVLEDRF